MLTRLVRFIYRRRAVPKRLVRFIFPTPIRLQLPGFSLYVRLDDWAVARVLPYVAHTSRT
ncbi:hypothetical protein HC891_10105 [Candidatus Gracilibacteria bacterium]|nr:hypothetical protein [Candidatus Gracilibacteria bacterium]